MNQLFRSKKLFLTWLLLTCLVFQTISPPQCFACPFCAGVQASLLDDLEDTSEMCVAVCLKCQENPSEPGIYYAELIVTEPLKSKTQTQRQAKLLVPTFDLLKPKQAYLVKGYGEQDEFQWVTPTPVDAREIEYLKSLAKFTADNTPKVDRLKFFFELRDSSSKLIADDCFNELGKTSLEELKLLQPWLSPEKIKQSLRDEKHTTDRKRLDWVLLGICGSPADGELFEELLAVYHRQRQQDAAQGALLRDPIGLDAGISTYITLLGEPGLQKIEATFLQNPNCDYSECFSAIMAVRVQGDEIQKFSKERLAKSLAYVLDRQELADLVVADLARWEQWDYAPKLMATYRSSASDDLRLRIPIINYLRLCPTPAAELFLQDVRRLEPQMYRRAQTLFPEHKRNDESMQ